MNAGLFFTALALLGGVALAVQSPTNALVARATGSPIAAALVSFAVGGVALAAVLLASGGAKFGPAARALPAHAWLGGLYGAFFVAVAALAAPRIGVSALLTAAIAGQIVAALLLDHFGLLGLPRHPLSATRAAGAAVVIAGALLVRRG